MDAVRHKSALDNRTLKKIVIEEDVEEENGGGSHESSLVAECVECLIVKSDFMLGVIDGVFPTMVWHMGTLAQVAWMVLEKKFQNGDGGGISNILSLIKIPEELVDAIIIIGPLSCLPKGCKSCSSLKVVI